MATQFEGVVQRQIVAAQANCLPDRQLLRRFVENRDEGAFAVLVRRHSGMVLGVCRSVLRRDSEDACQATFLLLARKAGSVRNPDALASWLHAVAYRVACKARKEVARRHACEQGAAVPECQPSDDLSWREVETVLHEELRRLPEKYRLPLILCCLEGRTRDEAARQLGWSVGKLKGMLDRGRSLLLRRLDRRGLGLSAALLAVTLRRPGAPAGASEATVQAARAFAEGKLATPAATLADALLGAKSAFRLRLTVLVFAAVVVAAGMGVSLGYRAAPGDGPPPLPAERRVAHEPRTDRDGDPLPPGAVARMGTRRFLGGATSSQITYSPDGARLYVADWGGFLVLDPNTGKQLLRVNTHPCGVDSISLSRDGKLLALGTYARDNSSQSSVQIRDTATGQLLCQCLDPAGRHQYLSVQFSPDGKAVASYSFPARKLHLWDTDTGREIRHWPLAAEYAGSPVFTSDGKTLVACDGRTIFFWDIATGHEVRRIADHPGAVVYRLVVSPDGKLLASQALKEMPKINEAYRLDGRLYLWDTANGKQVGEIEYRANTDKFPAAIRSDVADVSRFHFSPDGRFLLTTGGDGVLSVWDVAAGGRLVRQWDAADWGSDFAFSPDGKVLASLGSGTTVRLWDPATGKELHERTGHRSTVSHLALSPDGRILASAGPAGEIRLWDPATGREIRRIATKDRFVEWLRFTANGRTLITTSDTATVRFWDVHTGSEGRQFQAPINRRETSRALSPDGKNCVSTVEDWDKTKRWATVVLSDAMTGKQLRSLPNRGFPEAVGFSADGKTVRSWSDRNHICEWDVATGAMLGEMNAGDGITSVGRFSPDGTWFVCTGRGEALLFYHLPTRNGYRRIDVPGTPAVQLVLEFSPDSRTLALGDASGIRLYEMASGKARRSLAAGDVTALTFSRDGRQLVSGSSDTTALAWDLTGHDGRPRRSAKLSPAEAEARWADLASEDAAVAYRAEWTLVDSPDQTVALLKERLRPAPPAGADRLALLINRLDAAEFAVRDEASKELERLGERAEAALRRTLAGRPSAEQRQRVEALVGRVEAGQVAPPPSVLREVRAVEALELIGTPEAGRLLRDLATGGPEARLTRETAASSRRLAGRSRVAP